MCNSDTCHLLSPRATVLEALQRLNDLGSRQLVLFVVDNHGIVLGSITDGDIRRALVKGASPSDNICSAMHRDYASVAADDPDLVTALASLRQRRIKLVPMVDGQRKLLKIIDLCDRRSYLPVDAVIMAGGRGERLRPATLTTPKPLLKLADKAIIDHNVDRILSYGIENINVTVNYLKEQIIKHFEQPRQGVQVRCTSEEAYLGTIGALRLVEGLTHDTVLVMNSDIFTNIDLEDFYLHFRHSGAAMSIAAVPYTVAVPYGIMDLEGQSVKGIIEKPTFNYYANGGLYLLRRECLQYIPENQRFDATDLIEALIGAGLEVTRYPINGTWIDIGTPEEYRKAIDLAQHLSQG